MDPAVITTAIGVGGTVLVGAAGFSAALIGTRKTIQVAREHRLWDRRAEVYVEAIAAVNAPPDWFMLEARLLAFGTERVFTAAQAGSTAHEQAIAALQAWKAAPDLDRAQAAVHGGPLPGPTVANPSLYAAAEKAQKAADDADDALA